MYLTREDFGLDLFEAIKCIGGLLAIQDQHNAAVHHSDTPRQVDLKQRREQLKEKLTTLMHRLSDADVAEILRRYPMVGTL